MRPNLPQPMYSMPEYPPQPIYQGYEQQLPVQYMQEYYRP